MAVVDLVNSSRHLFVFYITLLTAYESVLGAKVIAKKLICF